LVSGFRGKKKDEKERDKLNKPLLLERKQHRGDPGPD
jgi:hypothetical protein